MILKLSPKKSLGQNFLTDVNIAKKIVLALAPSENDIVLEIGPGTGALTKHLVQYNTDLSAVELDKEACRLLKDNFPESKLKLFNMSILDFDMAELCGDSHKKIKVIGNLPYYLSSEIFFKLFENSDKIDSAILMIQKEVALRLYAEKSTKAYGILSLATAYVGKAQRLFDVPPGCFFPKPKVTSTVIKIDFENKNFNKEHFFAYMTLLRAAFNQRRKTLRNSLAAYIQQKTGQKPDSVIAAAAAESLDFFKLRAEQLSLDDFLRMKNFFDNYKA